MATYPTGWLRLPTDAKDFKERFAWSHVKAIFYDKAKNILLKDKLDAMDKLISDHADAIANKLMTNDAFNTAIADYVTKSMMSGVQVNDGDHVPTSALAYAMQQAITANANAITKLNSDLKVLYYGAIVGTEDSVVPSNTQTVAYSFNVDAGVYIAFANIRWSSNAKGSRHIGFAEKTTEAFADMNAHYSIVAPSTDGMTFQNLAVILKYENPAHVDIRVQQFSGGDLKIRTRLSLLKVK